ncbi:MAG: hypothetical protein V4628_10240 [Pseudomonadota bacterium]
MKNLMRHRSESFKRSFILLFVFVACACSKSLDSVDGPQTGNVSGLVCNDLPTLSAALEVPAVQSTLIKDGKCLNLRSRAKVDFVRTVMMPGDGKYSQFEYEADNKTSKLWIRTSNVR